jgi:hypothetical protein
MDIGDLTIKQARELAAMFGNGAAQNTSTHPMLGQRCLVRTYSAGVHIGDVVWVYPDDARGRGVVCKIY